MSTHNLCFEQKYEKYQIFLSEFFHFHLRRNFVYIFEQACFRNVPRQVGYPYKHLSHFSTKASAEGTPLKSLGFK